MPFEVQIRTIEMHRMAEGHRRTLKYRKAASATTATTAFPVDAPAAHIRRRCAIRRSSSRASRWIYPEEV